MPDGTRRTRTVRHAAVGKFLERITRRATDPVGIMDIHAQKSPEEELAILGAETAPRCWKLHA